MHDALYSLLLAVLSSTLLLGSCGFLESKNDGAPQTDSTYFRAALNGEEVWTAIGTKKANYLLDEDGFELVVLRVGNFPGPTGRYSYREVLHLVAFFRGADTYSLVKGEDADTGSDYWETEGDVIISSYHPTDDTSANRLTITSYDSTTGLMEGTFRTTLVVDSAQRVSEPGEPPRRRPDTLRYTNGEFRVKVEDRR